MFHLMIMMGLTRSHKTAVFTLRFALFYLNRRLTYKYFWL